jgi:hypothetical protein
MQVLTASFDFWEAVGHFADLISIVGFPLAVVGLFLALRQLDRTQNAVEAANDAAKRTERDSAVRQLLLLLPGLAEIEQALDNAISSSDHSVARRELASWRLRGGEVQGMLTGQSDLPDSLQEDLARAIVQAGAAKQRLLDETTDIAAATERAQSDISRSVIALTELAGRLKTYALEEEKAT